MQNNFLEYEGFKYEGISVDVVEINGKPHFEIYSTGMALGYIKSNSNGGLERIEQTAKNADIVPSVHGGHRYFSEEQLYDFMLEARTIKCKPFRKWVTSTVLPTIRAMKSSSGDSGQNECIQCGNKVNPDLNGPHGPYTIPIWTHAYGKGIKLFNKVRISEGRGYLCRACCILLADFIDLRKGVRNE